MKEEAISSVTLKEGDPGCQEVSRGVCCPEGGLHGVGERVGEAGVGKAQASRPCPGGGVTQPHSWLQAPWGPEVRLGGPERATELPGPGLTTRPPPQGTGGHAHSRATPLRF